MTGFYLVLLGFPRFYFGITGCYWVLLVFTSFLMSCRVSLVGRIVKVLLRLREVNVLFFFSFFRVFTGFLSVLGRI